MVLASDVICRHNRIPNACIQNIYFYRGPNLLLYFWNSHTFTPYAYIYKTSITIDDLHPWIHCWHPHNYVCYIYFNHICIIYINIYKVRPVLRTQPIPLYIIMIYTLQSVHSYYDVKARMVMCDTGLYIHSIDLLFNKHRFNWNVH